MAVIDIGSNSIHLDIFSVKGRKTRYLEGEGFYTKLGRYLTKDKIIPHSKIQESSKIIKHLKYYAFLKGAREVLVFGTSILRKAKNRKKFSEKVFEGSGLKIDVVSTVRESSYLERIAREKMSLGRENLLLIDIGGGSTELVLLNKRKTLFKKSYPYGLSKTKAKFKIKNFNDSVKESKVLHFFRSKISLFLKGIKKEKIHQFVGFSSVAKTFALIKYSTIRKPGDFSKKVITLEDMYKIRKDIKNREKITGVEEKQHDLVYIGTFFFEVLFERVGLQKLRVSPYSIREGYLIEHLNKVKRHK